MNPEQGSDYVETAPEAMSPVRDDMALWLDCAQQALGLTGSFLQLASAELDLALASGRRLLILGLLLLPVTLFAWIGISAMVAWLGYLLGLQFASNAVAISLGLLFFILQQVGVIFLLLQKCRDCRKNMRFAQTRKHVQLFRQGLAHELQGTHSEGRTA